MGTEVVQCGIRALSAQKLFWSGECMAMRPFARGKWADDATVAGRQAGHAASGHSKKAQKTPLNGTQKLTQTAVELLLPRQASAFKLI